MSVINDHIKNDFQLLLTLLMSIVGTAFLTVFGLLALYNKQYTLATYLLIPVCLCLVNIVVLKSKYHTYSSYGVSFINACLVFTLIAHGGVEKTGLLWTYCLLTMAVAILPFRIGCIFCFAFVSLTSAIMLVPHNLEFIVPYSFTEATRYISSSLALCMLTLTFVKIQENTKQKLQNKSITDELTGLYNRSVISDSRKARLDKDDCSIMLIDIDFFKSVNDEFGHYIGDRVLILVSETIKREVRDQDLAIRWGGEEFLVILKDCTLDLAVAKATSISQKVQFDNALTQLLGKQLTLSIGVAIVNQSTPLFEAIKTADKHLYNAKNSGRNKIVDALA